LGKSYVIGPTAAPVASALALFPVALGFFKEAVIDVTNVATIYTSLPGVNVLVVLNE
jgi:hypothetical protein